MKQRKSDILWKAILEEVFDDALRFIFPDAELVYDLTRGFCFLDKELAELYPEPDKEPATRHADKMVKVYTRKGEEDWILMHIEIQGDLSDKKAFSERMFRYFYRILDKHRRPVSAVVIYIGRNGRNMPGAYFYRYRGTEVTYKFHTIAVQEVGEGELRKSDNPFAFVLRTVKTSLLEGRIPEWDLVRRKVMMANDLLTRPFPKDKIRAIFSFLESYVLFVEPSMNRVFSWRTESSEKIKIMNMTDFVRMEALEEGMEIGMEKGMEKGIEKGMEKGMEKGVERGKEEGRNEERVECARRLLADTELSLDKIAGLANIPVAQVEEMGRAMGWVA